MSLASRLRQQARRAAELARYLDTPAALARRALVDAEWARGRVAVTPGSDTFVEGVSMVYPEPVDDSPPFALDSVPQPA